MNSTVTSEARSHSYMASAEPREVRELIRENHYAGHTAGLCDGLLQCNLVILPQVVAADFQKYCQENSVFCPLLGTSETGEFGIESLGKNMDLRTDLPLYNVYRKGQLVGSQQDITGLWRDDFVAFAIGCSFTFERALLSAGIGMRHIEEDVTVPMYKTNIKTNQVGAFGGSAVVSMRPIKSSDIDKTNSICEHYTHAHGAPVHVGDPSAIGIANLNEPDWGASVSFAEDEHPVFWGCGVTTQVACTNAAPEICITHAPGAMMITELDELSNSDWRAAGPHDE